MFGRDAFGRDADGRHGRKAANNVRFNDDTLSIPNVLQSDFGILFVELSTIYIRLILLRSAISD
jgi:hypothetical protein